jgi:hypothetical protein
VRFQFSAGVDGVISLRLQHMQEIVAQHVIAIGQRERAGRQPQPRLLLYAAPAIVMLGDCTPP